MSLLTLTGVRKSFGAVDVLHGVDLTVAPGEVVGLVGDNGAGKSTLMKCITGMYRADTGEIALDGRSILGLDPGARRALGIEMIYQDLALARQQDVPANIFLGREPTKRFLGLVPGMIDRRAMRARAQEMIDRLGAHLPGLDRAVGSFSGGQQQTVAIARALTFDPKLVIMDEPTAALGPQETARTLKLIETVRDQGIAVVVISHSLDDVFAVSDRIQVMRRGKRVGVVDTRETDVTSVLAMIVGATDTDKAA